ncbi:MAG: hypothetical protein DRG25_00090 [Deltaproteobacteria bacterium]|nr:MAG: hypothetical protein DRG25_00090 [Deltaproteobacteria bacterium]
MKKGQKNKKFTHRKGLFFLLFLTILLIGVPILTCLFLKKPLETFPQCLRECYLGLSIWILFFIPYAIYLLIRSKGK